MDFGDGLGVKRILVWNYFVVSSAVFEVQLASRPKGAYVFLRLLLFIPHLCLFAKLRPIQIGAGV